MIILLKVEVIAPLWTIATQMSQPGIKLNINPE